MTARPHADDSFDEDTLPEIDAPAPEPRAAESPRDAYFLDFKDGRTRVAVTHGRVDPSRIWITLRSEQAVLQISIEENVGREIAEGLARVLPTFRAVRCRL